MGTKIKLINDKFLLQGSHPRSHHERDCEVLPLFNRLTRWGSIIAYFPRSSSSSDASHHDGGRSCPAKLYRKPLCLMCNGKSHDPAMAVLYDESPCQEKLLEKLWES